MRHDKLPWVQKSTSRALLCSALVTAMLVCGQCRVCGVDGLGSAGSLNVTFARNSRNSRVCTDPKGSIATAGAGIDVMAPVPYFYPVDATGAPLPGECWEFRMYDEPRDDSRDYRSLRLCGDYSFTISLKFFQ